jgi:hypothetical protein
MATRIEIINRNKVAYRKASKKEKGQILDNICMNTGLSRSRIKHIMTEKQSKVPSASKASCASKVSEVCKPGRAKTYDQEFVAVLEKMWAYMDFACGRRLVAGIPDMLDSLMAHDELNVSQEIQDKLRCVSAATADRLLANAREGLVLKGKSTTKPGTLLKKDIPFRLGNEWNDAVPGYVEIDLVAHCGETVAGEYVNTLDVTDICTGWTETVAVINKAQKHVFAALMDVGKKQPFPFRGIDSDNGSEFINSHLYRYCKENDICFTRSRPYRKNDNCHVEQKNWHTVRKNIGYDRYEGTEAVDAINNFYDILRLQYNFFLPQTKLLSKIRDGAKVRKVYDVPKTPYRRVLESDNVPQETKNRLMEIFSTLNLVALGREKMNALQRLKTLSCTKKS